MNTVHNKPVNFLMTNISLMLKSEQYQENRCVQKYRATGTFVGLNHFRIIARTYLKALLTVGERQDSTTLSQLT